MAIDPTKASGSQPLSGPRLDQAAGNAATPLAGPAGSTSAREGTAPDDQVELSDAARAARPAAGTTASGLSAERLQEILKRVTSGFYDDPRVIDKVARRLADEFGTTRVE